MTAKEIMEKFNEKMEDIKKWNKETFPDATLGGQLEKLEEEICEYMQASNIDELRKERADVFIVLGGLRRWESKLGQHHERDIIENSSLEKIVELLADVDNKMEINKERTRKGVWKKQSNGSYHH